MEAFIETTVEFQPNSRQQEILALIGERGFAGTEELARKFSRTTQTIRRDFDELEKQGLVIRVHGGASANMGYQNRPFVERLAIRSRAKQNIGTLAASQIENGKCVFLSLGTSTEAVAQHLLGHENMQFVTNNLHIAQLLSAKSDIDVQICGGQVRNSDGGLLDPRAIDMVSAMRFDYGVIGIGAIGQGGDLYCYDVNEMRTARAIINNADTIILVADENKFTEAANYRLGSLKEIDLFITDQLLDSPIRKLCEESDVKVLKARQD